MNLPEVSVTIKDHGFTLTRNQNVPFVLGEWIRIKLLNRFINTPITDIIVYQDYIDGCLNRLVAAGIIDFWNDRWVIFQPECLFRWVR